MLAALLTECMPLIGEWTVERKPECAHVGGVWGGLEDGGALLG